MLLEYAIAFATIYVAVLFLLIYLEESEEMEDPKPEKFPSISILVPAYNEGEHIAETLKSLLLLEYPGKREIIVINDGSKDDTGEQARKFAKKGVIVIDKPNGGKASAMNVGIKRAKGELVAVLDADSIVAQDALLHMVGYFGEPEIAAVTPMMKVWESRTPAQKLQKAEYILNSFTKKLLEQLDAITVTPGPFSIYRASVFKKLGGFDEETLTEDQEIALRMQRANMRIASSVGAIVYTDAPADLRGLYLQRKRWYTGFLQNIWRYRDLLSPKYGDLGVFVLPVTLGMLVAGIFALLASISGILTPPEFRLDFIYADLGAAQVIMLFAFILGLLITYLAAQRLHEKNSLALFATTLIMSPILTLFWLLIIATAAFNMLSGGKEIWRGG